MLNDEKNEIKPLHESPSYRFNKAMENLLQESRIEEEEEEEKRSVEQKIARVHATNVGLTKL